QSGWQATIGTTSPDEKWKGYATKEKYWDRVYGDEKAVEALLSPGFSVWLFLFALTLLGAIFAAVLSVALHTKLLPMEVPAGLAGLWPMRSLLVGGIALVALLFMLVALFSGLPLEQKAVEQVKKAVTADRAKASTAEERDTQRWDIEEGIRLGG